MHETQKTSEEHKKKSIFTNSKISIYQILILIFQFVTKAKVKSTISLLKTQSHTVADWNAFLRNACTRMLMRLDMRIGRRNKVVQIDETHFFKVPKHHRGKYRKLRNWLFVAVNKENSTFYCYLVRKRTRPALETITNACALPGMHIESDEHKSHFLLGKTTNDKTCQPCRPALHTHAIVNHSKGFKSENKTHANKVEGFNSLIKGPCKAMKGLPKSQHPCI